MASGDNPITVLPYWYGIFANTVMLNAWFIGMYPSLLLDIDTPLLAEFCMLALYVVNFVLPRLKKPPDKLWPCWRIICRIIWHLTVASIDPPITFWLCKRIALLIHVSIWHYSFAVDITVTAVSCIIKRELCDVFTKGLPDHDKDEYSTLLESPCGDDCFCQEDNGPLSSFTIDETMLNDDWFCQPVDSKPSANVHGLMLQHQPVKKQQHTKPKPFASKKQADQLLQCGLSAVSHMSSARLTGIIDSGATSTSIGNRSEFVSLNTGGGAHKKLDGIAQGLDIKGEGIVEYLLRMDCGAEITLRSHAYWVPELGDTRLLSPQSFNTAEGHRGSAVCHGNRTPEGAIDPKSFAEILIRLDGPNWQRSTPVFTATVPYHRGHNLPVVDLLLPGTARHFKQQLIAALCVTDDENRNLTGPQKDLLRLHFKLGHIGFKHIQWMVRQGHIQVNNPKAVGNCKLPKCASCQYGKATRRNTDTSTTKPDKSKEMSLKRNDLVPGQRVSVDHYQSSQPGRLYTSRGSPRLSKSAKANMYQGGAIYVDHASKFISIQHQTSLSAADTVKGKLSYERDAYTVGVILQQFHTDNGVFTSKEFMADLMNSEQSVRFSGVGAAHQNGSAERNIQTIVNMARTMMLHAALRSPSGYISPDLWPMAMDHAVWLYNHIPSLETGLAPIELWSRSTQRSRTLLSDCHVWGCPTFVLEPKLQKGGIKIPKWAPRSRQGIFVGFSKLHSSLIGLILNRTTGSITAQFHLVFDDSFSTVHSDEDTVPDTWNHLITRPSARLHAELDDDEYSDLSDEWLTPDERIARDNERRRQSILRRRTQLQYPESAVEREQRVQQHQRATIERENNPQPTPITDQQHPAHSPAPTIRFADGATRPIVDTDEPSAPPLAPPTPPLPASPPSPLTLDPSLRRSTRTRQAPQVYSDDGGAASRWKTDQVRGMAAVLNHSHFDPSDWTDIEDILADLDHEESLRNYSPHAMAASKRTTKDPDLPNYFEAMSGDNSEDYRDAMKEEVEALTKRATWELVDRSSVGSDSSVIPGTWAFRCKRRPDGSFRKFKARYCVRGDIEKRKATEEEDTYSPVVQWSTVRLLLVLTTILGLHTRSIDFSNAFAQASIPEGKDVYIEVPKGFAPTDGRDCVMKLKKSLYGSTIAPRLWYEKISKGLIDRGFVASKMDPCLFISSTVILVLYVDDCCIFSRNPNDIDKLLKSFDDDGDEFNWEMTIEGSVTEFLGIEMTPVNDTNGWKLTQRGLIDKVLDTTGLTDCNSNSTPTSSDGKPLGKDADGEPFNEEWNYASVVGMLLYLASNSRPDLAFSVHQAARFTHNPKASHGNAIKHICRYLKGTLTDGLILQPGGTMNVDCWVDADFCGLFGTEDVHDPSCVKSRTGFIITVASCPVLWVSRLQTEIAMSTVESEFSALSQSMRALIPLRRIMEEINSAFHLTDSPIPYTTKSTVFEDNSGALQLAKTKKMTARTRHMAVKYFWFLDKIHPRGPIHIEKVDSKVNIADHLTKNLQKHTFQTLRKLFCGW